MSAVAQLHARGNNFAMTGDGATDAYFTQQAAAGSVLTDLRSSACITSTEQCCLSNLGSITQCSPTYSQLHERVSSAHSRRNVLPSHSTVELPHGMSLSGSFYRALDAQRETQNPPPPPPPPELAQ